jgi:biopolymer transport protein ExbB
MKRIIVAIAILVMAGTAFGEDLRVASQKAKAEYEAAALEAKKIDQRILDDRKALESEVALHEKQTAVLKSELSTLKEQLEGLLEIEKLRNLEQTEQQMDLREYTGVVREAARDLESILTQSHFSAFAPDRLERISLVLAKDRFPGMAEMTIISDLLFEEMTLSSEIDRHTHTFISVGGDTADGDILTIGPFCAIYRGNEDTGYLNYNQASQRFFALSKPAPWLMRHNLNDYLNGKADAVTFDFSMGAALRQLIHRSTLKDKIKKGGLIVWPILGLGLLSLVIALERTLFLNRVHANTDRLMGQVNQLASKGDWAGCDNVLKPEEGKPVHNVLRAGLSAVNEKREILESVLQEAILKELPRLERFLPALNIMGAVAPLLGLLGTVTGMISTFQSITIYGAGDPRMMSGGISEALITTMLGLAVAIPIMLVHTFLRRRLEHIIGDMEEKAVALSNIICRECALVPLMEHKYAVKAKAAMAAGSKIALQS